jgi:signal transduction protein with GAF and PtsI domain
VILLTSQGFSIDQLWPPTAPYLALALAVMYLLYGGYLTYHQLRVVNRRKDRSYERLLAILKVTRTLGVESDPQRVFDCITATCRATYECDQVSLMILDEPSRELEVCSVSGHLQPEEVLGTRMKIGTGVAGWVAEQREAMVLGAKVNHSTFQGFQSKAYAIASAMIVPVILRERVVGVLSVTSRTGNVDYDQEDLQSLQVFAEYVGICIRYAEHGEEVRRAA